MREPGQVHAAAEAVLGELGGVDILVNNAAGNFVCPTERMSANAWRAVLGIVLDGTFYCSRDFGRAMGLMSPVMLPIQILGVPATGWACVICTRSNLSQPIP